MPFDTDIVGHAKQIAALKQAIARDRLHHAYVFLGPEGVGKKTLALALAKAIHCRESAGDFCGRCASCVNIESRNHPDVRLIAPAPGKKEITIDQVRALEKELSYRAFSDGKKVAVIDPASAMNLAAQNALLKTLEEPPAGSLLILVAASAGALLPTVLSRCLKVSFGPLAPSAMADCLVARKNLPLAEAELLAAISFGSLGRALDPAIEELARERRAWVEGLATLQRERAAAAAWIEALSKDRDETLRFLDWLEEWYRDILIYRATENAGEICNLDLTETLRIEAARVSAERLLFLRAEARRAGARIRRNVNRRLALESLLNRIAEPAK